MPKTLDDIFADDSYGLLNEKPKVAPITDQDRMVQEFEELSRFVSENGREPSENSNDPSEYRLAKRLAKYRSDSKLIENQAIYSADVHGLLHSTGKSNQSKEMSFDEILDSFNLNEEEKSIFDLHPSVKKAIDRDEADFIAKRKPCKDFSKYESKFKKVQNDIRSGKRKLLDAKISHLKEGGFYFYNGVLFFVESIEISQKNAVTPEGKHIYENGRTRCIFENGTEAALLKRSVEKLLYLNGKTVTENSEETAAKAEKELGINEKDKACGFIYVCSSLSKEPSIAEIKNLYKIGFCTTSVEERLKNAEKEPTYLMAPVRHIASWQCFNMNPQKFEQLIHNFFGRVCLNVDVFDEKGERHIPKEWFVVPLPVIKQVIEMIITGEIIKYRYDEKKQVLVKR